MATARTGTKGVARAEREEQILDQACRIFGEKGYVATSVADIARAAGISKPLIYAYFDSKDGLHAACVERAGEIIVGEVERSAASGAVALDRALVTLDGIFTVLAPQPWLWPLAFDATVPPDSPAATTLARYAERLHSLALEGVGELLSLTGSEDAGDLDALTTVWTSVFSSLVDWWIAHPDEPPEAMSQRCHRIFGAVFGTTALA
jgi:AcrR family transcriptional regulator